MRARAEKSGYSVTAIAGNHVVLLGLDAPEQRPGDLLGFAIEREDLTENEKYFLRGFKVFAETGSHIPVGALVSTAEHPVQTFLWGDYTAKPDHAYVYTIYPVRGRPKRLDLDRARAFSVRVETEPLVLAEGHSVFFNRGVAAAQAYARKFKNAPPDEVEGGAAWAWLSRGLEENLLAFIDDTARGALHCAFYELRHAPVLDALRRARDRGVDVRVVYDRRDPKVYEESEQAIRAAGIGGCCTRRETNPSYIAHNKFMVRVGSGDDAVWTGSTNISRGGIFGHSNVGHLVRAAATVKAFESYFQELARDPEARELRTWTSAHPSSPTSTASVRSAAYFSPRKGLAQLDWYAKLMDKAREAVFFTAAFGVNQRFEEVIGKESNVLRYLLLERTDADEIEVFRRDADTRFAVGGILARGAFGRWAKEKLTNLNGHVKFIHTKFMLVDPLAQTPLVVTGSANFSEPSTKENDENMLVIKGDRRVADIYLSEFMRLFHHFAFRSYVGRVRPDEEESPGTNTSEADVRYLATDSSWTAPYFRKDAAKAKERRMFSGAYVP